MQNKLKWLAIITLVVGVLLPTTSVFASNFHIIFGADYVNSDIKYNNEEEQLGPKEDFQSISPVIGISAYGVGLEAFFFNSDANEKDSLENKLQAYGIAIFGEANLSDNFALIASLGLAEYKFKIKKDKLKYEEDCEGPRIGIGLQYYLTRNIAIRGMYHYTLLNSGENDAYEAISEFTAGIRFIF